MLSEFVRTIENDINPVFIKKGAKLIEVTPTKATFLLEKVEISIYNEREFEIYATIFSLKQDKFVYLSELLSDYLHVSERGIYFWSDKFSINMCIKKIVNIIVSVVIPLILDGKINDAINEVISKREEGLIKYYESQTEKVAEKAFKEKKYDVVIMSYAKIRNLTSIQKRRLEISLTKKREETKRED